MNLLSNWKYVNNLAHRLKGTWRVLFGEGQTLADYNTTTPLTDLGDVDAEGLSLTQAGPKLDDFSSKGGTRVLEDVIYYGLETQIQVKLKEIQRRIMKALFRGQNAAVDETQGATTSTAVDNMDFSGVAARNGTWYQIERSGVPQYGLTGVALETVTGGTALVEGTDYEVMRGQGIVRFLKARGDDIAVKISGPAMTRRVMTLDRTAAVRGMILASLWAPRASEITPRYLFRADTIVDFEESLDVPLLESAVIPVRFRSVGVPELIDFSNLTEDIEDAAL